MHFEQRRPVIERRAAPEARDAVANLAVNAGADRIDAVLEPAIGVELEVGGGKPEPAAAAVAGDDRAGDEPGMADDLGRPAHPARAEPPADPAPRAPPPPSLHR